MIIYISPQSKERSLQARVHHIRIRNSFTTHSIVFLFALQYIEQSLIAMGTRTTHATRKITADDANLIIQTIRVTIHSTGKFFEGDTRSGNHASIYLLVGGGSSIRLNMIKAGPTDRMGTYDPKYCSYHDSTSSIRNFDVQAVSGLTVNHVLSLVNERRRHAYRLARSGVGCRFWVSVIPGTDPYIFLANLYR